MKFICDFGDLFFDEERCFFLSEMCWRLEKDFFTRSNEDSWNSSPVIDFVLLGFEKGTKYCSPIVEEETSYGKRRNEIHSVSVLAGSVADVDTREWKEK